VRASVRSGRIHPECRDAMHQLVYRRGGGGGGGWCLVGGGVVSVSWVEGNGGVSSSGCGRIYVCLPFALSPRGDMVSGL